MKSPVCPSDGRGFPLLETPRAQASRPAHAKGPAEGEAAGPGQGLCYPANMRIEENAGVRCVPISMGSAMAERAVSRAGELSPLIRLHLGTPRLAVELNLRRGGSIVDQ